MSRTRTRQTAATPFTVSVSISNVRQTAPVVLSAFALIMSLLFLVGLRMETTRLSTLLTDLHTTRKALTLEVNKLETEQGYRIRPDKLEAKARLLGLSPPKTDEIIILDE